jgi:K+-sensing histidine kinase KdpD
MGGYGLPIELLRQFSNAEGAWLQELLTSMSAEILKSTRDRAHEIGAPTIVLESRGGNVAQAIIDFAEEKDANAIVVGNEARAALPICFSAAWRESSSTLQDASLWLSHSCRNRSNRSTKTAFSTDLVRPHRRYGTTTRGCKIM